jgi:uncharacterized membrane protein
LELIQCGTCGSTNYSDNRFCTSCGSPLRQTSGDALAAKEEIRRLRELTRQITARLDALEKKAPLAPPPGQPSSVPPAPAPAFTPPQSNPAPVIPKPVAKKQREWEQILGGNWLARIGVLAIIIGIGFFLKYAFDNNWLGPTARIVLGAVAGLVMLGLGYYWRKRYPIMTQVLSGGGIAVLYLAIFASFSTYHLVSIYIAIVLLFIVSGLSAALALRYNSMALAIMGILGAFFAPFILGAFSDGGTGTRSITQAVQLLVYIIVIDTGVLLLSAFRNWRWFTLLALACSLITYGFWHHEYNSVVSTGAAVTGITIIFLTFTGATSLFHIVGRRIPRLFDYFLIAGNAVAYTGISLGLMWGVFRDWLGGFTLLLAIFYGLLAFFTFKRNQGINGLSLSFLIMAILLLTVAIPVQFRDHAATTIGWAIEMTICVWLSFIIKIPLLRYLGYAVYVFMSWRLLFFDTRVDNLNFRPILNERFLAFIIAIAATYLTIYILRRRRDITIEWPYIAPFLLITINLITLWLFSFEVWDSYTKAIRSAAATAREGLSDAQNLSLTALWAVYAVAALITGIKKHWRYVRLGALALLLVPIIKVFVYDVFKLGLGYRIGAFVGLGVLLLVSAYLYQRYRKIIKGVFTNK